MSGFNEWSTPKSWIEDIRSCIGSIDFDAASNNTSQQIVQATEYATIDNSALVQTWFTETRKNVYCNPPYSRDLIKLFVDKFLYEWSFRSKESQCIFLVNTQSDTKWFHDLLKQSECVLLVRGRIKFLKIMDGKAYEKWEGEKSKAEGLGKIGNSPRYLNSLFYFGDNVERFHEVFESKGIIL